MASAEVEVGEQGDVAEQQGRGADDRDGRDRTTALTEAHAEIEHGLQPQLLQGE